MQPSWPVRLAAGACLAAAILAPPGAAPRPAAAATATTTFNVTATVLAYCTVAALPLAFGNYTETTQLDGQTTLTVTCTKGTPYMIGLDNGLGPGATPETRVMRNTSNPEETLRYGLYRDATRSAVWGATSGTDTQDGTGTGQVQTVTVYGRVPANQFSAPGAYQDTVTVTLTY